jgi:hypothetical protein
VSDLAIEFRVKNGRLKRAILATGVSSYAEFCRKYGFAQQVVSALLGMRKSAWSEQKGDWKDIAYDISAAVHREPEELWPAELRTVALKNNAGEFGMTLDEATTLGAPAMRSHAIKALAHCLTPREMKAVTAIAKGQTLDEAAKGLGENGTNISRERARQIYLKGVRRMREEARKRGLKISDVIQESAT